MKEYNLVKEKFKVVFLKFKVLCRERNLPSTYQQKILDSFIEDNYNRLLYEIDAMKKNNADRNIDWDFINNFKNLVQQWQEEFENEYNNKRLRFFLSVQWIKLKTFLKL
ncbi:hypothetical protein [Geosporobacter ferrireducens]|uniref:Uncharacterized protein n=1 Tax=Geosporobacter ferrireducens TaxID=1424294 RepID=A0A1D8GGD6_9FIRM|nr:hypothetical protein [Geosporobacter ferrireducens]AOT69955.1 hypothetical protein Gferi_10385 [Geosporobacter ferrireducens]MTI58370.1 hypothetical protein [Geosporobacter ferrireducens]